MASEISISNMALSHIGQSKTIQSFDENTTAALWCSAFYEHARDVLLSEYPWLFAKQQLSIALTGKAPTGWAYQYALPINCLNPLKIYNPLSDLDKDKIPFERRISTDGKTQVIVTNKEQAELIFTQKVESVNLMPDYFIMALSYKLATYIAGPITKNDQKVVNKATSDYYRAIASATGVDAQAFYKAPKEQSDAHSARMS